LAYKNFVPFFGPPCKIKSKIKQLKTPSTSTVYYRLRSETWRRNPVEKLYFICNRTQQIVLQLFYFIPLVLFYLVTHVRTSLMIIAQQLATATKLRKNMYRGRNFRSFFVITFLLGTSVLRKCSCLWDTVQKLFKNKMLRRSQQAK